MSTGWMFRVDLVWLWKQQHESLTYLMPALATNSQQRSCLQGVMKALPRRGPGATQSNDSNRGAFWGELSMEYYYRSMQVEHKMPATLVECFIFCMIYTLSKYSELLIKHSAKLGDNIFPALPAPQLSWVFRMPIS